MESTIIVRCRPFPLLFVNSEKRRLRNLTEMLNTLLPYLKTELCDINRYLPDPLGVYYLKTISLDAPSALVLSILLNIKLHHPHLSGGNLQMELSGVCQITGLLL